MSQFTIMIDTGCDLPEEFIKEHNLAIIPIPFNLDGKEHVQGRWQEITDKQFYDALRNGGKAGTTLINPETFTEVFTEYAKKGEPLLHISLSSGLSGTYQNALLALKDVEDAYPDCKIRSVDSLNAAPGIGLLTTLAVNKRAEGASLDETADYLEAKRDNCLSMFTVDDLMFLHRGGRVSKFSAIAGSIIGVKPVLNVCPEGTLKLKDKARGRKGSLEMLVSQMKRSLNADTKSLDNVLIGHCDSEEDAQALADMIKADYDVKDLKIVLIGPVIGAHSGPGTIALFFEGDMTRAAYEAKFYPEK